MNMKQICKKLKGKVIFGEDWGVIITENGIRAWGKAKNLDKTFKAILFLLLYEDLKGE